MDKLQQKIAEYNEAVRDLNIRLTESNKRHDEYMRKMCDISTSLKLQYKKTFGDQLYTLRSSTWDTISIQLAPEEFLDQIIQDFIEGTNIKIETLNDKIEEYKEEMRAHKNKIKELETVLHNSNRMTALHEQNLEDSHRKITELELELNNKDLSIGIMKRNMDDMVMKLDNMEDAFNSSDKQRVTLKTENTNLMLQLKKSQQETHSLNNENTRLMAESMKWKAINDNIERQYGESELTLNEARREQDHMTGRVIELQHQLSHEGKKVRDLEDQLKTLLDLTQAAGKPKNKNENNPFSLHDELNSTTHSFLDVPYAKTKFKDPSLSKRSVMFVVLLIVAVPTIFITCACSRSGSAISSRVVSAYYEESLSYSRNPHCKPSNLDQGIQCSDFEHKGQYYTDVALFYMPLASAYYVARLADAMGYQDRCPSNETFLRELDIIVPWSPFSREHRAFAIDLPCDFRRQVTRLCSFPNERYPFLCNGVEGSPGTYGRRLEALSYYSVLQSPNSLRWTLFFNCWRAKTPKDPSAVELATSFNVYSMDPVLSPEDRALIINELKRHGFNTDPSNIIEFDYRTTACN